MAEFKARNMLQKLSLTPKRNMEQEAAKSLETEEQLLQKLKVLQEEKDYLNMSLTYEKLADVIENRNMDKVGRPEHGKLMFYYQAGAQNLVKIFKGDVVLPFEQYFAGDIVHLYDKALNVAVRYMDPSVVHTLSREAGFALLCIDKPLEARDMFMRGEQRLEALPPKALPDLMERLLILFGIMETFLIEERWNDYLIYTDKIWMMGMKEAKKSGLSVNITKESEQLAVLLLLYQKDVECSERHKQLLASYRLDDWKAPIVKHNPPLSTLSPSEQKVFRRFLFYVVSNKRSYEKCAAMIPEISDIVARPFRIEVHNNNDHLKNLEILPIYSRTCINFFHHAARNYCMIFQ
ncbi:unnamed protein product [Caenorhabditis nigoni]